MVIGLLSVTPMQYFFGTVLLFWTGLMIGMVYLVLVKRPGGRRR